MKKIALAAFGFACALPAAAQQTQEAPITLLAAGSLRDAMRELGEAWRKDAGGGIAATYGPSGKLRQEIEGGRKVDVFASASVEHTEALAAQKLLARSLTFAYNDLCVVSTPALGLSEATLVETLLRPSVRLATSTPVSDPMGDYTWQFFRNADKAQPGAFGRFEAKALKLSGASAPAPGEKLPYVTAFEENKADAYIMYCTNAAGTLHALPQLKVLRIPDHLNVRSAYGIGAAPGSRAGERFVDFVMGPAGQAILRRHGFN
ncbi:substrate-binding domain-containing protein [uncultured Massilia sp.]|uniref:substrate-binding domain-containing protein n=1 Tax=uncultured Massilia sp. TaxID=169973 RepID=UPI00258E14BC|nr:substrate-binding domain-containing protein [uncultured Massilia sp.]